MQARQIESELEAKTNAFAKLCSGYDGAYTARGESGLAAEQVSILLHAECMSFQYQANALSNCQCLLFWVVPAAPTSEGGCRKLLKCRASQHMHEITGCLPVKLSNMCAALSFQGLGN